MTACTDRAGRTPIERIADFIERLRADAFNPRQRELPLSQPGSNQ